MRIDVEVPEVDKSHGVITFWGYYKTLEDYLVHLLDEYRTGDYGLSTEHYETAEWAEPKPLPRLNLEYDIHDVILPGEYSMDESYYAITFDASFLAPAQKLLDDLIEEYNKNNVGYYTNSGVVVEIPENWKEIAEEHRKKISNAE